MIHMKTHSIAPSRRAHVAALLLFALPCGALFSQPRGETGVSATLSAPTHPRVDVSANATTTELQLATTEALQRGVRHLAGQEVRGIRGETLGHVKDFVLDARTGRADYAVVASGGVLGAGDDLHAVPIAALKRGGEKTFVILMDRNEWNQTPVLVQEAFGKGIVTLSDEQRSEIERAFARRHGAGDQTEAAGARVADRSVAATQPPQVVNATNAPIVVAGSTDGQATRIATPDALKQMPWVRASELRGRALHAEGTPVGEVEEILIDLESGGASAVVDPIDALIGGDQKVLVPVQRLTLVPQGKGPITARLGRADFIALQPPVIVEQRSAAATVLPNGVTITTDAADAPALAPTGPTATGVVVHAEVATAAQAVRVALDRHASLASANVGVGMDNGRIVLRGSVRSETDRIAAEQTAREATRGVIIDNQLVVDAR